MEDGEGAVRESFYQLLNARENPPVLAASKKWLTEKLEAANLELAPNTPESLGCKACFVPGSGFLGQASSNPRLWAFHAPLALLEGAWLQSIAQADNGHQTQTSQLFAVYLALLGKDEAASPAFAYRGALECLGVSLPKTQAWAFAHDARLGLSALAFASLQLALGLHAARFFGEALGFTLAYLHSGSSWRLAALPEARRQSVLETMGRHTAESLQSYLIQGGEWEKVRRGYAQYCQAEAEYSAAFNLYAEADNPLAAQVAEIFRRKRPFAQGYHCQVRLGGRAMEEWLAETPFDVAGFLAAFAASPFAQGKAGQRPFGRLNAFGGPMFGVFDSDEIGLIDAWLDEGARLPEPEQNQTCFSSVIPKESSGAVISTEMPISKPWKVGPRSLLRGWSPFPCPSDDPRGLYHRLIDQVPSEQTFAQARRWVETVLARSRRKLRKQGPLRQRFFLYTPQHFAERIRQIHAQEVAKHQPFQPPPKLRREEYRFGLLQFAPAILVDGCWLRHQGEAANQDSRLHRLLYRIFAEELGEGRVEWNHPKLYRDLLESLNLDLPATDSEDFARHPGFLDSAFDLPDYLLAISLFPNTYLPELLGLNLGIELSGLGSGYMRLSEELNYWGINPLIVNLHLSIDNLAGGHSAMACEAIQLYLEEIRLLSGDDAVQAAWRRVWSGYLSLEVAARRFKWALILAFCRRFMPQRIVSALRTD